VGQQGGQVIFYARDPGAFGDLADDARRMLSRNGQVVVDRHLTEVAGMGDAGIHGLAEFSDINQAVGVLSAMGHQAAQNELHRQALEADRTVLQTARDILSRITTS
jgi:hypothetical protein